MQTYRTTSKPFFSDFFFELGTGCFATEIVEIIYEAIVSVLWK